jgi:hypothetical protein
MSQEYDVYIQNELLYAFYDSSQCMTRNLIEILKRITTCPSVKRNCITWQGKVILHCCLCDALAGSKHLSSCHVTDGCTSVIRACSSV